MSVNRTSQSISKSKPALAEQQWCLSPGPLEQADVGGFCQLKAEEHHLPPETPVHNDEEADCINPQRGNDCISTLFTPHHPVSIHEHMEQQSLEFRGQREEAGPGQVFCAPLLLPTP